MIPINDMRFTVKVDGNGDTLVKGRLCFDAKYVISKYVVSASVEDLVKRCMREETWRKYQALKCTRTQHDQTRI